MKDGPMEMPASLRGLAGELFPPDKTADKDDDMDGSNKNGTVTDFKPRHITDALKVVEALRLKDAASALRRHVKQLSLIHI
eukprot:10186028-Alexandrium_andersonii.AAC.1